MAEATTAEPRAAVAAKDLIHGASGPFEVIVGLEVHAQVVSAAKLFSAAPTEFGGKPNAHVSPIDAGMPGMLPTVMPARSSAGAC